MKHTIPWIVLLLSLTGCGRLDTILMDPPQTPQSWLAIQPYWMFNIASRQVIIVQPSTSFIVYLLGLLAIAVGIYFLRIRNGQRSRAWWGIALILWGVGALVAGTSYEAFSYAIKCAGRDSCLWTSWWEIAYLLATVWSIDAMALAVAYSSTTGGLRKGLSIYAIANAVAYFILVTIGVFIPVRFLVSFEFLLVVGAPGFLALFVINVWHYIRLRLKPDLLLSGAWLWMAVTIVAYFLYYMSGYTAVLWEKGLWFSENDVLHIFLIIWMIYIAKFIAPATADLSNA